MEVMGGTAKSRFSLAIPNQTAGRIFCSPEQSKLCFEALETRFCASKPLALAGSFKTLSEVEVLLNIKMDL